MAKRKSNFSNSYVRQKRLRLAANLAVGAARSWVRSREPIRANAPQVVSAQRDFKTIYKRKKRNYAKVKKGKKFARKVTSVQLHNANTQFAFVREKVYCHAAGNSSGYVCQSMYGISGDGGAEGTIAPLVTGRGKTNDIGDLMVKKYTSLAAAQKRALYFNSAVMDCVIKNTGGTNAIVEVYEVIAKKSIVKDAAGSYDTIEEFYANGFNALATTTGTTSATAQALGTTPFNSPLFCENFTILKKTRLHLGIGDFTAIQLKDTKSRRIDGSVTIQPYVFLKGASHGFLFQVFGDPNGTVGQWVNDASIKVVTTKAYSYRELNVTDTQAGLVQ